MIFNLAGLQSRQAGSSTRAIVLLRAMLIDTTVHHDVLLKQALSVLFRTLEPSAPERLPDDLVRQGIRPAAAAKKGEPARGMINEAEKRWPGVKAYLNATGLGGEPKLIRQLVARAERRPGHQ
jgi:hypothetical protein